MIRAEDHLRAGAIALMVLCLAISPVVMGEHAVSGWDGSYLLLLTMLAAAVAYYSNRFVRGGNLDDRERRIARVVELATLYVVLQLWDDIIDEQPAFIGFFPRLDWKTVELFIPILLVWFFVGNVSALFRELEQPLFEGPNAGIPPARQLTTRFFIGGIILFVCASLTQQRVMEFMRMPAPGSSGPVLNVLLYFLLGMALLGHIQYATLQQRWRHHNIAIATGLGSRWARYSLLFVAVVALLAFILPTSHTANLLDPGRSAWDQVWGLLQGPLRWLLTILGKTAIKPRNPPTIVATPPHLPPPPKHSGKPAHASGGASSWLDLSKVFFFWALVLAALIYLIRTWSRNRPKLGGRFGKLGAVLSAIGRVWSRLRRLLQGIRQTLGDYTPRVRPVRTDAAAPVTGLRRLLPVRARTPREQVMQYYLSTVRRARREGFPRRGSQTPYEFDAVLAPRLLEAEPDMHRLTDAFVEARYSHHGMEEAEVGVVRGSWRKVRDALRHLKA